MNDVADSPVSLAYGAVCLLMGGTMRDTCANACERLAVIYVDVVMWPNLIHHKAPIPLCAECYVDLWMNGVQMGTRDVDGELRLHVRLGRYDRPA